MQTDASGFLRPVTVDGSPPEALSSCPGLGSNVKASAGVWHPIWGEIRQAFVGWANDPEIRYSGSSGGAVTGICGDLIEVGRVDAVLHCGAADDDPTRTEPKVSGNTTELMIRAGSRYAPSSTLSQLSGLLETGLRYVVVGKPCEIAALAEARRENSDLARVFPVLVSFFCAGVPSQHATASIIKKLGAKRDEIDDFRYRGNGWPGLTKVTFRDGTEASMRYSESWGALLSPHLQTRCKLCADGVGMAADIVCADAWEVDARGYPVFEERPGESVILSRTALGDEILEQVRQNGALTLSSFDLSRLDAMQPGQVKRRRAVLARLIGRMLALKQTPRFIGHGLIAAMRGSSLRTFCREGAGSFYRAINPR